MIKKAYCLFEQSGTFKKEFKKLGIDSEDFDIRNEFGETDTICDLFEEIDRAYEKKPSIFDEITPDDLVFAFFPCTRFENQINLWLRGENYSQMKWTEVEKIKYAMKIQKEVGVFYDIISKLTIVAIEGGVALDNRKPLEQRTLPNPLLVRKAKSCRP